VASRKIRCQCCTTSPYFLSPASDLATRRSQPSRLLLKISITFLTCSYLNIVDFLLILFDGRAEYTDEMHATVVRAAAAAECGLMDCCIMSLHRGPASSVSIHWTFLKSTNWVTGLSSKGVVWVRAERLGLVGGRQWQFYVGARGHRPPKSCPGPKFLDTVVLLLVELIGSIVISLSLPNDEGPGPRKYFFLEPPLEGERYAVRKTKVHKLQAVNTNRSIFQNDF